MRYALSARSRKVLSHFAASRVLFAFDFDGTLAPIVNDPERACMRRTTRRLLSRLARIRTCAALSGRSRADLAVKLAGTGIQHLIGNHGAEPWAGAQRLRRAVRQWERELVRRLPDLPGLWVENKGLSLTVHYRRCRQKAEALSAIVQAVQSLPDVRLIRGKEAVSVVSQDAPHKGMALMAEWSRLKCDGALYVGDDETDEDVFALPDRERDLLTIRVGRKNTSRAGYFLRNQAEVDELLRLLVGMCSATVIRSPKPSTFCRCPVLVRGSDR
jgi:trehalose 6-phosphate phosphatase